MMSNSKIRSAMQAIKINKKMRDLKIKHEIRKKFVFNDSWKRSDVTRFSPQHPDISDFYRQYTFDNQRQFGKDIVQSFLDLNTTHVLAVAPTQSGKTGSMLAIIYEFTHLSNRNINVPVEHIFIFTGHSSREWLLQTRERFPNILENNILHRNNYKQFIKRVKHLSNVLIIFDESHIANKFGQTLYNIYHQTSFFDIKHLYQNNIKIVHFTATPDSLLQHTHIWGNSLKVCNMRVPKQYVSIQTYIDNKQIFQMKPLIDHKHNILELLNFIQADNPFYHIIRTPRGDKHFALIQQFKLNFKQFDFEFISEPTYYHTQRTSIFELFMKKPKKHTFIFIIDKLRCAKTIHIQHVRIIYERFVLKPNYESILQGLAGRTTGFHDNFKQIIILSQVNSLIFTIRKKHTTTNIFNPF